MVAIILVKEGCNRKYPARNYKC